MAQENSNKEKLQQNLENVLNSALEIIKNPIGFFQMMPKSGGYIEPLIFLVIVSAAAAVIQIALGIIGIGYNGGVMTLLSLIIFVPFFNAVFGFVGAAALYIIWKIMGSEENYETAFRCGAYTAAIVPVVAVVDMIPYLGTFIKIGWTVYLLVIASSVVHKIKQNTAWVVFGVIGIFLLFSSLSVQSKARKAQETVGEMLKGLQQSEELD